MPCVIRDTVTGEIVKMRSGKSVWSKPGHAKAAFATSGCYVEVEGAFRQWGGWGGRYGRFDDQTRLEIVEATIGEAKPTENLGKVMMRLAEAEALLAGCASFLEDVHAGDSEIAEEIRAYFKEAE